MVNDLGFAVPISGNTDRELYEGLMSVYLADKDNPKATVWGAFNAAGNMNKFFYDAAVTSRTYLITGKIGSQDYTVDSVVANLNTAFSAASRTLRTSNKDVWDIANWPPA
jgi:hypothetical protein